MDVVSLPPCWLQAAWSVHFTNITVCHDAMTNAIGTWQQRLLLASGNQKVSFAEDTEMKSCGLRF